MDEPFVPAWMATMAGSMPLASPATAWDWINQYLPQIPAWPQLTQRTYRENMYAQFARGFPGAVVDDIAERTFVDRSRGLETGLEHLYLAYLEDDLQYAATTRDEAAGLHHLLDTPGLLPSTVVAIKGQVTGPISWGLTVTDENRRPVLYDDILADAVAKHLRMRAAWQEQQLQPYAPHTILFVDEPYMSAYGSAFVSLERSLVVTLLEEVLSGINGVKGVHCCGNTDWSVLMDTSVDILHLDAYEYAESLALYPESVSGFLQRGGIIAWGIVPAGPSVEGETTESLVERLHEAMGLLVVKGIALDDLLGAGLVMPSCGLGPLDPPTAQRVLELTARVSTEMQARYVTHDDEENAS
jgi:hypothetical protein